MARLGAFGSRVETGVVSEIRNVYEHDAPAVALCFHATEIAGGLFRNDGTRKPLDLGLGSGSLESKRTITENDKRLW